MAKFSPAKKSLGQHFLYDQRVLNKIVRACELTGEERVLEVGPGRGHLTKLLAESGAHVTAVEVDPDLYNGPLKIFESIKNVDVLLGDARAIDLDYIFKDVIGEQVKSKNTCEPEFIQAVEEFVDVMPAQDANHLRTEYDKMRPDVDLSYQYECEACEALNDISIPFSTNFFWLFLLIFIDI